MAYDLQPDWHALCILGTICGKWQISIQVEEILGRQQYLQLFCTLWSSSFDAATLLVSSPVSSATEKPDETGKTAAGASNTFAIAE